MIGLRKEDALDYLSYHAPDVQTQQQHERINYAFQQLVEAVIRHQQLKAA